MARPQKIGLDYFTLDCDILQDTKVAAVIVNYGAKGFAILVDLLSAIYRNGYFIEWNEGLAIKVARDLPGVTQDLVAKVVELLAKFGFFDETLLRSASILTSPAVQRRFLQAKKHRPDPSCLPYWVLDSKTILGVMDSKTPVMDSKTPVMDSKTPAKSKVKKNKKNNSHYRGSCQKNDDNNDDGDFLNFSFFSPPSLADVKAWCLEPAYAALGATEADALDFLAYNEGQGWRATNERSNPKALFYRWLTQKGRHTPPAAAKPTTAAADRKARERQEVAELEAQMARAVPMPQRFQNWRDQLTNKKPNNNPQ